MAQKLQQSLELSRENLTKVDRKKLMAQMAPFAVGMVHVHPEVTQFAFIQQLQVLTDKQQVIRRQQMLLLQ